MRTRRSRSHLRRASKAAPTSVICRRSRSTPRRRRISTTRSPSSARATACARMSTSPTSPTSSPPGRSSTSARRSRSCSVYVPGRVARMLPAELADDSCSLRPHLDRLTLTVEIPFGPGLEMGTPVFYRSVIRSDARLTYGLAEDALAGTGEASAGGRRAAPARGTPGRGASPSAVRARCTSGGSARGHVRVRRRGRDLRRMARERAARAHACRGAHDPRQRSRRGPAGRPPPRGALSRSRSA